MTFFPLLNLLVISHSQQTVAFLVEFHPPVSAVINN